MQRSAGIGPAKRLVYRAIANFLSKKAGISEAPAQTGAVTLIQRFGSALNLNLHCHRLFLDGVYSTTESGPCCRRVKAPTPAALDLLVHTLSDRIAHHLARRGWLVRDDEHDFLTFDAIDDSTFDERRGYSNP